MAANTGERTLIPALIPPGAAHVHGVASMGSPSVSDRTLVSVGAYLMSLLLDFAVRTTPKSTISPSTISRLSYSEPVLQDDLVARALRLNAVTGAYGDLWASCYSPGFMAVEWTGGLEYAGRRPLGEVSSNWSAQTPLRIAADRRQALLEIDALVGLSLGLSVDELATIYRTQFPVLYGYDQSRDYYDANGRLVPSSVLTVWRIKREKISTEERTASNQAGNTYTYELPFTALDREADMRQAYLHFEKLLRDRS